MLNKAKRESGKELIELGPGKHINDAQKAFKIAIGIAPTSPIAHSRLSGLYFSTHRENAYKHAIAAAHLFEDCRPSERCTHEYLQAHGMFLMAIECNPLNSAGAQKSLLKLITKHAASFEMLGFGLQGHSPAQFVQNAVDGYTKDAADKGIAANSSIYSLHLQLYLQPLTVVLISLVLVCAGYCYMATQKAANERQRRRWEQVIGIVLISVCVHICDVMFVLVGAP
jgi:hypothetical protein